VVTKEGTMSDDLERLRDFIDSIPDREGPFVPFASRNEHGDSIEFVFSEEDYYGKWVNSRLTLYISQETGQIVGCEIGGVSSLEETKKPRPPEA
jgi:hypothetical protein